MLSTFCIFLSILVFRRVSASSTLFLINRLTPKIPAQKIRVCPKYINTLLSMLCPSKKNDKKHIKIPENSVKIAVPYCVWSLTEKSFIFMRIFLLVKIIHITVYECKYLLQIEQRENFVPPFVII